MFPEMAQKVEFFSMAALLNYIHYVSSNITVVDETSALWH